MRELRLTGDDAVAEEDDDADTPSSLAGAASMHAQSALSSN